MASRQPELLKEPLFFPLGVLGGESTLEIIHPEGCRIRVIGAVNPVSLRLALQVLDERGAR